MVKIITDHLITVFGLKRSGQHGIIYWLMSQFKEQYDTMTVQGDREFFNNQRVYAKLTRSPKSKAKHKRLVVLNYEDVNLANLKPNKKSFIADEKKRFGVVKRRTNIIILRDPFNFFASRLKHTTIRDETVKRRIRWVRAWKIYAREALGYTNLLPNIFPVIFNKWFVNIEYRKEIVSDLGLYFTDSNLNFVSWKGSGSSFDSIKYRNSGQKMDVLNRWKQTTEDKSFMRIFKDREIVDLSESIFGHISGTETIIEKACPKT